MIQLIKNFILVSVIVGTSYTLGLAINNIVPWYWLTYLFTIVRHLSMTFNFMWDIPTVMTLAGIGFSVQITVMSIEAIISLLSASGLNRH